MTATTIAPSPLGRERTEPFLWLFGAAIVSALLAYFGHADLKQAFESFPLEVVAIFVALELYTDMVRQTGVLDRLALRAAGASRAERGRVLAIFAGLLMVIGLVNNNLTAILVAFPVLMTVLRVMNVSRRFVALVFAMLLAVGNCAGAATPVGDFPALLIMSTGMTSFSSYLVLAFPLFAVTALVLVLIYRRLASSEVPDPEAAPAADLALDLLTVRHRHQVVDRDGALRLGIVFVGMVVCWITVPFDVVPPALVAWAGLGSAAVWVGRRGLGPAFDGFDLNPVMRVAAVFFVASVVSTTRAIPAVSEWLIRSTDDPRLLLLALMLCTATVCAVVDAGGAAAALLPLVQQLTASGAPLENVRSITVVAFAAAICAGSSAFLTSATAGQLLASKVQSSGLRDDQEKAALFTFRSYLCYGLMNASVQLALAAAWAMTAITVKGWF